MMNLYFADTSYFLALLIPDDEHHDRAVELAQDDSANYVTTAWVLAEVGAFLADPKDRRVVLSLI